MIRRVRHDGLLESITPRAVNGGHAPLAAVVPTPAPPAPDDGQVQGYRQGYAEGFQAGEEDGRREAGQYQQAWEEETRKGIEEHYLAAQREREQLAALVQSLQAQLQAQQAAMEQQAFELALQSLSHAFGSKHDDGELLRRLCRQLSEEYRGKVVTLQVAAADRACLPDHLDGLEIAVEHALSGGECRIVTARGYADSSIALRLQAIYEAMLEALETRRP